MARKSNAVCRADEAGQTCHRNDEDHAHRNVPISTRGGAGKRRQASRCSGAADSVHDQHYERVTDGAFNVTHHDLDTGLLVTENEPFDGATVQPDRGGPTGAARQLERDESAQAMIIEIDARRGSGKTGEERKKLGTVQGRHSYDFRRRAREHQAGGTPGRTVDTMRVWIDQDLCTGDGLCTDHAPDVFRLLEDGIAYVVEDGRVLNDPGGSASLARVAKHLEAGTLLAADCCPGECIFVEPDEDN